MKIQNLGLRPICWPIIGLRFLCTCHSNQFSVDLGRLECAAWPCFCQRGAKPSSSDLLLKRLYWAFGQSVGRKVGVLKKKIKASIHDLLWILLYTHPLKWKKLMLVSLKLRCRRAFAHVVFPLLSSFGKPSSPLLQSQSKRFRLCKSQSAGGKKGRPSSSNPSVRLSPHSAPARYCRKSIS